VRFDWPALGRSKKQSAGPQRLGVRVVRVVRGQILFRPSAPL